MKSAAGFRTTACLAAIVLMASIGVYLNSLENAFVYDDMGQVLENRWITDIHFARDIFTSNVWSFGPRTVSNYYRPMMHLIYMFNYYVFGLTPRGFHLVNVAFHAANSLLVFVVAKRLLAACFASEGDRTLAASSHSQPSSLYQSLPAFAASLLFAAHPVHTEAVAWVAGIPDLSYTLFCLLSLYFYMRQREENKRISPFALLSFGLAVLCKEPALTLPFILMAYDIAFHHSSPVSTRQGARGFFWTYFPYGVVSGIYLALRYYALGGFSPQEPHVKLSAWGYLINAFPLFAEYLGKLILPLHLNAFHVFHPISSLFELKGMLSLLLTLFYGGLVLSLSRKDKPVFFALFVTALPLLPVLYIPALGENVFAERYLYLPSLGFVLLIATLFPRSANDRFALSLLIVCLAVTAGYSIASIDRNAVWKDNLTLFADTATKSPDAALVHENLGNAYGDQNRSDEAIAEYKAALALRPFNSNTHYNIGIEYERQNRIEEAIAEYMRALTLKPDDAAPHNSLGGAYLKINDPGAAAREFITALRLDPRLIRVHNELGTAYYNLNRIDEAMVEYRTALRLEPDNISARLNLERCFSKLREMKRGRLRVATARRR